MRNSKIIASKIWTRDEARQKVAQWKTMGKTVAFTNGCFDILHEGHLFSLSQAAAEADFLIVGLNSDLSTQKLKGKNRPVNKEQARALILAALMIVDGVVIFEEETPLNLIKLLMPNVLVKGGDYTVEQVAGSAEVIAQGGRVVINPLIAGISTTAIIEKMKKS
jgi:D-beta-D-heptose 7-phosphate kinase/D-beta-D-heptose 1-phosphate adenosyltransferase